MDRLKKFNHLLNKPFGFFSNLNLQSSFHALSSNCSHWFEKKADSFGFHIRQAYFPPGSSAYSAYLSASSHSKSAYLSIVSALTNTYLAICPFLTKTNIASGSFILVAMGVAIRLTQDYKEAAEIKEVKDIDHPEVPKIEEAYLEGLEHQKNDSYDKLEESYKFHCL